MIEYQNYICLRFKVLLTKFNLCLIIITTNTLFYYDKFMNESKNLLDPIAEATHNLVNKTYLKKQDINEFVCTFKRFRFMTAEALFSEIALKGYVERVDAISKIKTIRESMGQLMENPSFIYLLEDTDFDPQILFRLNQCRDNLIVLLTGPTSHPQS